MCKFNHLTNFLFSTILPTYSVQNLNKLLRKNWISLNFYFDRFLAFTISQILYFAWFERVAFADLPISWHKILTLFENWMFKITKISTHHTQPNFHFAQFAKVKFAILPILETSNSPNFCHNWIRLFRFRPL